MKKLLTVLLGLLVTLCALAQDYEEVVYLKNGSIVRGTVIEQVPGESLKIQTSDGSIFVYNMSEVERITKEQKKARQSFSQQAFGNDIYGSQEGLLKWSEAKGFTIDGLQASDKAAIQLMGVATYDELKELEEKYKRYDSTASWGASIGLSCLLSFVFAITASNDRSQNFWLIWGTAELGTGLTLILVGATGCGRTEQKIQELVGTVNQGNGLAFRDTAPVPSLALGPQMPRMMEYTPMFSYRINF